MVVFLSYPQLSPIFGQWKNDYIDCFNSLVKTGIWANHLQRPSFKKTLFQHVYHRFPEGETTPVLSKPVRKASHTRVQSKFWNKWSLNVYYDVQLWSDFKNHLSRMIWLSDVFQYFIDSLELLRPYLFLLWCSFD